MSWLIRSEGESSELKRLRSLIKRLPLLCTHLLTLVHLNEVGFGNITRSIKDGHSIVENNNSLKHRIGDLLEILIALLNFVDDREAVVRNIEQELERLRKDFNLNIFSVNKYSVQTEMEKLLEVVEQENGDLKLIRHLHKELISVQGGKLVEIYDMVRGEKESFPKEHQHLIDEFLFYLKKLIGALHQVSKIIARVERLEAKEEANFGYLYSLLGEPRLIQEQPSPIVNLIRELEAEFDRP